MPFVTPAVLMIKVMTKEFWNGHDPPVKGTENDGPYALATSSCWDCLPPPLVRLRREASIRSQRSIAFSASQSGSITEDSRTLN